MSTFQESIEHYTLNNGLEVALLRTPTLTINGQLQVFHGGVHENPGEEGLAHFLEHTLCTAGSRNFTPEQSLATRTQFGYINASTSPLSTSFPVDMLADGLELYLRYISDCVFNPVFDHSKVNEERQRILREISDKKSLPGFSDQEDYKKALFGKSPLNYFVLGKEEVVRTATPEQLHEFHQRGYNASNMQLILVGAIPSNISELIEQYFGEMPAGRSTRIEYQALDPLQANIELHRNAPELLNRENPGESSAQLTIGMHGPSSSNSDLYSFIIMNRILGGGEASRLHLRLSQREGLAYGIGTSINFSRHWGILQAGGKVSSSRKDKAIKLIFEEFKRMKDTDVSESELSSKIYTIRYELAKLLESNEGHTHAVERFLDDGLQPEVLQKGLMTVTASDIKRVAQNYLPERLDRKNKYVLLVRSPK